MIYLDADMLVRRPLDHLFLLPLGGGGNDALYVAPDYAAGRPRAAERAACALFGAAGARPKYFNAGLFVMEPAAARLREFDALLASRAVEIGGCAEQHFINGVYANTWRPLPPTYNLQKSIKAHHPELWAPDGAHVWHFTDRKPWDARHNEENAPFRELVDEWWRVHSGGGKVGHGCGDGITRGRPRTRRARVARSGARRRVSDAVTGVGVGW